MLVGLLEEISAYPLTYLAPWIGQAMPNGAIVKHMNRAHTQLLVELVVNLTEHTIASKQGRATRKLTKHGNWLPLGANRPPSPLLDSVREKHSDFDQLVIVVLPLNVNSQSVPCAVIFHWRVADLHFKKSIAPALHVLRVVCIVPATSFSITIVARGCGTE
ncbi:hypothetical protein EMCRGX_G011073 [Ephydatia muelleri]